MTKETLSEIIKGKAVKYKLEPTFLLFSIAGTAEWNRNEATKDAIEDRILKYYFRNLSNAMREQAEFQTKSKKESVRLAGYGALSQFDFKDLPIYNVQFKDVLRFVDKLNEIKIYHVVAVKKLLNDVKDFKTSFGATSHMVDIVSSVFKEEVHQFQINAKLFGDFDIRHN